MPLSDGDSEGDQGDDKSVKPHEIIPDETDPHDFMKLVNATTSLTT